MLIHHQNVEHCGNMIVVHNEAKTVEDMYLEKITALVQKEGA